MKLSRSNIVLCKFPMPSEELRKFKLRHGLIVSKDLNNKRLDDVIIAICTSNISRSQEPTQYLIEGKEIVQAGIKVASGVKCESLLTINKSMLIKVLGILSENGICKVNECLKNALGLE
ncbi:MAG: type II toxin-antitoxin system PemK/MazF family toxin [Candidatus Cloacimonetes bacterium]|nr:type II toxin-antitoxin system PemK/MazF family toxin [Candidatus Cloacimonadota bacterium]MBL7085983.1 type II toxin-antitoxin system PemK/MazF family toxin [Candidatus Cloacimonadota bacterium]